MKQFFEKVLPTQGNICVVGIKGDIVRPKFSDNIDEALEHINAFDRGDFNTFFATGTFEGYQRKAASCVFQRSFFVDIDCGEGKPYALWEDGLIALLNFVDTHDLPKPVIVNSGHGVHAYWPFTDDVPAEQWKPYAELFKKYCITNGLRIDESVTADAARIMRAPGTRNLKGDPLPVEVIYDGDATDFAHWVEKLGVIEKPFELADVDKGLDADTQAIYDKLNGNFEFQFQKVAELSLEGQGCAQIKHILENAASCPEPLWYAGISVAVRCVDGGTAIHLMSEDYPGYSPEETERKAAQSLSSAKWAHSCDAFEKENNSGCAGCPHRARIGKIGPIALGKVLKTTPEEPVAEMLTEDSNDDTEDEAQSIRTDENPKEVPVFPEFLYPYSRAINGGIYYTPPPRRDKKGHVIQDDPELIIHTDLFPIKRLYSPHDGECLVMRLVLPKDPLREFLLPMRDVTAVDKLKAKLSEHGVTYEPAHAPRIASYLTKWMTYLINTQQADIMRIQQGWTENCKSFVLGTSEYLSNGDIQHCPASPMAKNIVRHIKSAGSYDEWKRCVQMFNDPGYEWHAFSVLCGFASPLMELTNVNGATLSLFSEGPGTGKTGALYANLSIWGKPDSLAVNEATPNALNQRMITSKNIPFGLDEQTNNKGEVISNLLYNISSGTPKLRMMASSNQERETQFNTRLIAVITANKRLRSMMEEYKSNTSAESVRVLEPEIPMPSVPGYELTAERGKSMIDPLKSNYGWAGPEYVQYLYRIGLENVRRSIDLEYIKVADAYTKSSEYRFLSNLLSVTRVAGEIINEMGILKFELDRIFSVVGKEMADLVSGKKKDDEHSRADILGDFINKNIQNCLVVKDGKVVMEPRNMLNIRAEVETGMIYIATTPIKLYLREIKADTRQFEKRLMSEGVLIGKVRKQMAGGWKAALGAHNVQAYQIAMDISHLFNEQEEPAPAAV